MIAEYKREANKSYLMITVDSGRDSGYQIPMLLQNRIPGILPVHVQTVNGIRSLCYEVTSYEAFTKRYEAEQMTSEAVFQFLTAISSLLEEMDRYLLNGNCVVLDPEYIFYGTDEMGIGFCYSPQEEAASDGLNRIARFILDHIDYEDKEIVEIAYSLFQESMKENSSIRDFIRTVIAGYGEHGNTSEVCREGDEEEGLLARENDRDHFDGTGNRENEYPENGYLECECTEPGNLENVRWGRVYERKEKGKGFLQAAGLILEILLLGGCNAGIFAGMQWGILHLEELPITQDEVLMIGIPGAFFAALIPTLLHRGICRQPDERRSGI